jgi:Domain of unknown function (DUF1877)
MTMGMVLVLRSVDENEVRSLAKDAGAFEEFMFGDEAYDNSDEVDFDKGWHALHYVLTGSAEPTNGSLNLFGVGEPVGEDGGYGPALLWSAEYTRTFRDALAQLSDDDLRKRFDPAKLVEDEVYLGETFAEEGADFAWEYVSQGIPALREFADRCVTSGRTVLSVIS